MSEDLHDIDDLFYSALESNGEAPSPAVWESLNANLDKKDAELYKRKSRVWKRASLLFLLLLIGFILYESGILKTDSGYSNENIPIATEPQKPGTPVENNQNHSVSVNINKNKSSDKEDNIGLITPENNSTTKKQEADFNTDPAVANNKMKGQKNWLSGQKINYYAEETTISPKKNKKDFLKSNENLLNEKINRILQIEKNNTDKLADRMLNGIEQAQSSIIRNSFFINNTAKNKKEKQARFFRPFWMITAFASYERAGYKLDSDLPTTINSIKHREVHEPSFSGGILATRQLKKHWGLQLGFTYSYNAIGISPQKMYALQDPGGDIAFKYITSSGYAYIKPEGSTPPAIGDSLIATEGKHTLKFVSVPVIIKYTADINKFSFTPGAGIEANFLTSAKVETEIERPNREIVFINKLNGAKSFYWSVILDAELRYQLNKKLSVNVRPTFRHALTSITENNVVETFPYSFGTGLGLTFKF